MIKFKMFGFGSSETTPPTLSPETAALETAATATETQTNPEGKRVLIVDDDPIFSSATATKLRSAGLQVRTAKEGSEAIAALGEQPADAVLMDINFQPDVCNGGMGSWDGFQLTTWLRGNPGARGARFIIVSNSDSPAYRQRAQQVGAVAYFHKPVDSDQLIAAVKAEN
jgi:chemosensory pili system protein ChpA (sensor histidine kinase/response regulator)